MIVDPADADRALDGLAETAGLSISARQREGVAYFLTVASAQAVLLWEAPVEHGTLELATHFDPTAHPGSGTEP